MKQRQREAIVVALDEHLAAAGSWCGETHLQKSVYLLQEMLGVPTGFDYILYKFGPFSPDLRGELGAMTTDGFLQVVPQRPPYGPKLHATDNGRRQLLERWPRTINRYDPHVAFVADHLGQAGVGQLERWATALWVMRELPDADDRRRAEQLHEYKPHVSVSQALDAVQHVAAMQHDARQRGLVNIGKPT